MIFKKPLFNVKPLKKISSFIESSKESIEESIYKRADQLRQQLKRSFFQESKQSEYSINSLKLVHHGIDTTSEIIENIDMIWRDLIKEVFEIYGINFGVTLPNIEYHNYLINNPINLQANMNAICGISQEMLDAICKYETGHPFGYAMEERDLNGYDLGDAGGHLTFGYGLLYHPTGGFMDSIKKQWTQEELEGLFLEHINKKVELVKNKATSANVSLNQHQIDAMVCAMYNFGDGFLNRQLGQMILANPNDSKIYDTWVHLSDAQGRKYPGLIKRRKFEADWYVS